MRSKRKGDYFGRPVAAAILLIALAVLAATVVQAVREESWGPVWSVGWLPAVMVASLYRPNRCRWPLGRSRS